MGACCMMPIDTRRVERMLCRAYEVQEKQTLSKPSSDGIRSGTVDSFGMSADTLRLLEAVDTLPEAKRQAVQARCGRIPDALNGIVCRLTTTWGLNEEVARNILMQWLDIPSRPNLKDVLPKFESSYSTLKRKCRKVCEDLDNEFIAALTTLHCNLFLEAV